MAAPSSSNFKSRAGSPVARLPRLPRLPRAVPFGSEPRPTSSTKLHLGANDASTPTTQPTLCFEAQFLEADTSSHCSFFWSTLCHLSGTLLALQTRVSAGFAAASLLTDAHCDNHFNLSSTRTFANQLPRSCNISLSQDLRYLLCIN